MSKTINGVTFEKMMRNALNNLYVHEKEINDMNVFPVADGDTGTNMRLTLEHGVNYAKSDKHLGRYLKELSSGMLLGARGNSGVILSQIFKGLYLMLKNDSIVNPGEMRDAFINGYKVAYKAVLKPVEGTILTVSRLGIENIRHKIKGSISMADTFKLYVEELEKNLIETPEILPVLKEANVLDSGAKGYIVIVEGMYKYLIGQIVEQDFINELEIETNKSKIHQDGSYYINLTFKVNEDNFDLILFNEKIENLSNEVSIKFNDSIVSLNLISNKPIEVMKLVKQNGNILSLSLENDSIKKEKEEPREIPFKAIVYIACVSGSGVAELYKDMGVDIILDSNPSTKDFLDAFARIKAEHIVILPNDKNIIETANQAVNISGLNNVTIISTRNIIEGYYSLAMDIPDSPISNRLEAIQEKVGVECIKIAKAVKEYRNENTKINIDDFVAYKDDKVLTGSKDLLSSLDSSLKLIDNIESRSSVLIFLGKNIDVKLEEDINNLFIDKYSSIECNIIHGGFEKEYLILGIL